MKKRKEEDPTCLPTRGRWSTEPPPRTVWSGIRLMVLVRVPDVRLVSSRLSLFHPCGPTCAVEPCGRFLRLPESIGSIGASLLSTDQSAIGVYLIRQYPCRYVSRSPYLSMTRLDSYEARDAEFTLSVFDN